jgi:hypothetical protein
MEEHILITNVWWRDSQWWAIIVPFLVALMLGALAIFQDWIRRLIWKPKLNVSIRLCSPDCQKIPLTDTRSGQHLYDSYYFRFRMENTGNYKMEYVEAIITEVNKKRANGEYKKLDKFLPLNLVWAHNNLVTIPNIQPGLFKHLNFGYIVQSENANLGYFGMQKSDETIVFKFTVEVEPNHGSHILLPGDYNITIKFAANNLSPVTKKYNLLFPDKWDDNEEEMLRNNIGIKEI